MPTPIDQTRFKTASLALIVSAALLSGCASTTRPTQPLNLCSIFEQHPHWYKKAVKAQKRWGTPIQVPLSIMYQESSFIHDARPPMEWFLFIPTGRASDAYGYPQAQDATWKEYKKEAGGWGSERDDFGDAFDFISWYVYKSQKVLGISKWDAKNQYLAYHDGRGGYKRGTYKKKAWLMKTAQKVQDRALRYSAQYRECKADLDDHGWF